MSKPKEKMMRLGDFEQIVQTIPDREQKELEAAEHQYSERVKQALSEIIGKTVDETTKAAKEVWLQAIDRVSRRETALVKPSDFYTKFPIVTQISDGSLIGEILNAGASSANEIIREYTPENTKRAFDGDLAYWRAWLKAIGHDFNEPIEKKHLTAFITQHAEGLPPEIDKILVDGEIQYKKRKGPHSLATINRRVDSLSIYLQLMKLPNFCRDRDIGILLQKLTNKYGSSKQKRAITRNILDDMLATCGDKMIDIRDKALLLFTWASGGRRRSEVVAATMENLTETEGGFVYCIAKSKTDQGGKGHDVPVMGRAAQALKEWLSISGVAEGPIFRSLTKSGKVHDKALSGIDVNRIVKKRIKLANYDESQFGAHSLRSGFITEGGKRGKPLGDIMKMTAHRNVATAMRYYESGAVIHNSAANLAD